MTKLRHTAMMSLAATAISLTCITLAQGQMQQSAPFQIVETSIDDIHAALKSGRLTVRQLVQGYLDRIEAYDKKGPTINSVITVNPNALEEADKLDAAYKRSGFVGPLHGVTVLVKDEIDAAGMPTTLGTVVFKDYRPPRDAFAIEKLRKAGAIILGKTTLSEFAAGDTYGSMFGVTRNPYDLERTVGGSSGGSGAALAANFSTVTIGEETLASIRRPGGWNGVAALRPTPGLVSRSGMWVAIPLCTRKWARWREPSGISPSCSTVWWATIRKIRSPHSVSEKSTEATRVFWTRMVSRAHVSESCVNRSGQIRSRIRTTSRRSMRPSQRMSRNLRPPAPSSSTRS